MDRPVKRGFEKELPPEPIDDKDVLIANLSEQLLNTQLEIENVKKIWLPY